MENTNWGENGRFVPKRSFSTLLKQTLVIFSQASPNEINRAQAALRDGDEQRAYALLGIEETRAEWMVQEWSYWAQRTLEFITVRELAKNDKQFKIWRALTAGKNGTGNEEGNGSTSE